jgi:magnesium-transporting ATPase (P-type)
MGTPRSRDIKEERGDDSFDIPEIDEDEELVYHGMSPDEITLVDAAKKVGYEFRYRSNKDIEIKVGGVTRIYKLLEVFKFTSERKRMTVIVQDPDDPEFVIAFIKGADNIMKKLSYSQFQSHFDFKQINKFAKKGYRTLLIGMKVIRYSEFLQWKQVYDELNNDIHEDHTESINNLIDSIENELFLLGTTALEDKLQENVYECIEEFRRADIKVWMITGDKLETAENVGISCRLLHDDAERFYFTSTEDKPAFDVAKQTYLTIKKMTKQNKEAKQESIGSESSDDIDLDRDSEQEVEVEAEVAEENKGYKGSELKNGNVSIHTHQQSSDTNKVLLKKQTFNEQYSNSDLFSQKKKLKITEKKLFVKQIVMNSSLNTSFNPNKVKNAIIADLNFELVIEGDCLAIMFKKENRKIFGHIVKKCSVILVCRASPKQKAEVVAFAKEINPNIISLAIGDGGNDVSMIKEADVGIGIFGKEGYQAISASDYAIAEFQFLRRLMFVHGRLNTRRMTIWIVQYLLKNLIFSLGQF